MAILAKYDFFLLLKTAIIFYCFFGPLANNEAQPLEKSTRSSAIIDSLKNRLQEQLDYSTRIDLWEQISAEYINLARHELALQYADSIKILAHQNNDPLSAAKTDFYYGVVARHQGELEQAVEHLSRFVDSRVHLGDSLELARGLFHLAVVYFYLGEFDQSLNSFYRVVRIYEAFDKAEGVANTLNSIGVIYRNMKRYDDAKSVLQRSIDIYDSLGIKDQLTNPLSTLANVYHSQAENREALELYFRIWQIDEVNGNELGVAYDLANIGVIYNELQQHDSALVYQLRSLAIREKFQQKYEMAMVMKQIGHTYFYLQQYNTAENYLQQSLAIAREIKAVQISRDVYSYLAQLSAAQKDYTGAFSFQQLYMTLQDSILNLETARQLNELKEKYESEKKDQEIKLLASEKEVQRQETERQAALKRMFLAGSLLLLLLILLLIFIFRQRLRHQQLLAIKSREISEARLQKQMSELEIKALRAQINPHFLFNCMNSINRMILQNQTEAASRYLSTFSKLVRMILENSEERMVTLAKELAMLEAYIKMEALRFKDKIYYQITVDPKIDLDNTYIPSMVLQPFVENAIVHGLVHKDTPGMIDINIVEENDRILCIIQDNGVGRKIADLNQRFTTNQHKSMGVKITEERLQLLNNARKEQLIKITDLIDNQNQALGTRVEIMVPLS